MNSIRRSRRLGHIAVCDIHLSIRDGNSIWFDLRGFTRRCLAMAGAMLVLMLGHVGAAHAQAYCFPANWYGFDLVAAANGQSTINDKTCGCGSSSYYVDSGGGCNAAATTRTTSGANNGNSWSVHVRSDYFSSCNNVTDITVSGSCTLTAKSQWYSVVATCSDHNTTATITLDSSITPLAPCVIDYMADSSYFDTVYVRDVIKFNNPITITIAAPAYAEIGSSFPVAATAAVGNVTISTSGNCTGGGTSSATITMTGASSDDCVVTYSSTSDANYAGYTLNSNTNNNFYAGAYNGIKLNFKAFNGLDMFMTCGLTCAKTAADSHSWLGAGSGVSPQDEQPRTYGMKDADNPNDTWLIQVADGTGADTTYTIKSSVNAKCLAKAGTYLSFASCNSGDGAQKWKIAPFNGSDPSDAPAGVEFTLPAYPGLYANVSTAYLSYKFGMNVSADHDWTSAFFFGTKIPPDHYRFEFDRTAALTCQAMPVTIKACLLPAATDPTCASLYPFTVSLRPAATKGTWSGFTASPATAFTGSSSGITLFDATAEATTFSYSLASVPPTVAALECYDTSTSGVVNCASVVFCS